MHTSRSGTFGQLHDNRDETLVLDRWLKLSPSGNNGTASAQKYFPVVASKQILILTRNRKKMLPSHSFIFLKCYICGGLNEKCPYIIWTLAPQLVLLYRGCGILGRRSLIGRNMLLGLGWNYDSLGQFLPALCFVLVLEGMSPQVSAPISMPTPCGCALLPWWTTMIQNKLLL